MKMLGIDRDSGEAFMGQSGVAPTRSLSGGLFPVNIFSNPTDALMGPEIDGNYASQYIFHEVSFDAVTKIRRGYVWRRCDANTQRWGHGDNAGPDLLSYQYQSFLGGVVQATSSDHITLTFGAKTRLTVGSVVHLEQDVRGMELITIRMREQFGLLPKLKDGLFSDEVKQYKKITGFLEKVIEGYRSSPPESIIDRCRDALTQILRVYLAVCSSDKTDLAKLGERFDDEINRGKRSVVSNLCHTVARLHARGKPTETGLPPITEGQGELALNAVGEVLVCLRWAEW